MRTQLTDITFMGGGVTVSLASLGLHVEQHGLESIFTLPSYTNVNSVDWQEYDGEDVDFSTASLSPLPLQIKVFGETTAVDSLVGSLRQIGKDKDIEVAVKIKEGTFSNAITFTVKYDGAKKTKAVAGDRKLEYYELTDEDDNNVVTEDLTLLLAGVKAGFKSLSFVTLSFVRHSNAEYFGLLADNTRDCVSIPDVDFVDTDTPHPSTETPIVLRRYHVQNRTATMVSEFEFDNDKVFFYPLRGVVLGTTDYEPCKSPFTIQTENMVGQVMQTRNSDKRRAKTIRVPFLIRSHSVSAIFHFLGTYKNYIHNTIKGGDMLYLHCEYGDWAVYPTSCNVTKAFVNDLPWIELTVEYRAYKKGFDFTATTDGEAKDNPEPPLPPTPEPTFDPYEGIEKTEWAVCEYRATSSYNINIALLVSPDYNETHPLQYPYDQVRTGWNVGSRLGWSVYSKYINRYPVGSLFFALRNSKPVGANTLYFYTTMVCLPWCVDNLTDALDAYAQGADDEDWSIDKPTLVGVVQGCEVESNTIANWESELQPSPKFGGIVGSGTVRVQSSVMDVYEADKFDVAEGLTLTESEDFDTLVANVVSVFKADPQGSGYYTEQGYNNSIK